MCLFSPKNLHDAGEREPYSTGITLLRVDFTWLHRSYLITTFTCARPLYPARFHFQPLKKKLPLIFFERLNGWCISFADYTDDQIFVEFKKLWSVQLMPFKDQRRRAKKKGIQHIVSNQTVDLTKKKMKKILLKKVG